MKTSDIDELSKRLLPISELRRNAGAILDKLPEVGYFILTKGGKPVAKISSVKSIKKEGVGRFESSRGAWKGTELDNDKIWEEILGAERYKGTKKKRVKL